jgi:AAA+ superfamily predicted ATPase
MNEQITQLIRAGYSGIYLVTAEEERAKAVLKDVAVALGYQIWTWTITEGGLDMAGATVCGNDHPGSMLECLAGLVPTNMDEITDEDYQTFGNKLILLPDYHKFMDDCHPRLLRTLKEELARGKELGRVLVFMGCKQTIPPELEKDIIAVPFSLPTKPELGEVLDGICQSSNTDCTDQRDDVLQSLLGMTNNEAECALALSLVKTKTLDPQAIWREKAKIVQNSGVLQFLDTNVTFDGVGGYEEAQEYYDTRQLAFTEAARDYGLPLPKGVLVVGVQGCGKSLMGKALANKLGRLLLQCNFGDLRGGIQGESESKMRLMMQTAEALAPCILFMDEIEKGLAGYASDHLTTGGTGGRQLQMLLPWMEQDNGVYIYATSNDISKLPPEIMRRGRFDEIFFVDLPNKAERTEIWKIQIEKYKRDPNIYPTAKLADMTEGFTGAEIEQAFIDALYLAFAEQREPTMEDIQSAVKTVFPLCKLMGAEISSLRKWATGRTRNASHQETRAPSTGQGKRRIRS